MGRVEGATDSLIAMRKKWNGVAGSYEDVIRRFHARGIMIYGTFVFGYDDDGPDAFERSVEFAVESGFCIANFNPLTPTPGTALMERLTHEGRLLHERWWLDPRFRYGDATLTTPLIESGFAGMERLRGQFRSAG